ncbi:hypothetical protein WN944_001349 [Citrus x changshan-huyou]|uniref:Uncharacterized protein n=1 Tax=Citrus x changshan-huyou TaxID=2935761 RepID=A0AAP0MG80_9ROSI
MSLLYCLNLYSSFDASVFSLVFAIIVAAFNIIYAGGVSDSSGLASPIDPAIDHQLRDSQVHNPSIIAEDVEVNDSLSMASCADHQLQNIQLVKQVVGSESLYLGRPDPPINQPNLNHSLAKSDESNDATCDVDF